MLKETSFYAESWNVAWRKKSVGSILNDKETEFKVIKNSFRYWAADPFVFEYEGKTYIFSELYDYVKCKGCLGYCELDHYRPKWVPIISEEYHLSYPYIFKIENEIFIMPESSANNDVTIYKAKLFPKQWEKVKIVRKNVKYGDTTLFEWKNHTYALAYGTKDENYQLFLLDLEEQEKDQRIECSEIECRRPAGKIFYYGDKTIRPAQNCKNGYGKGLYFYEFSINENNIYKEKVIEKILPQQVTLSEKLYLDGMHTYNGSEHYEVIDIKTRRFNILNFIFRIIQKFR